MPRPLNLSALLLCLCCFERACAAVLSSSKLEACVNDGSKELWCEKKVVLLISLEQGQGEEESAQFITINEVKDEQDQKHSLKKPWRVTWTKSKAHWRYPLRYSQDVNNKPTEKVFKVGFGACSDNPNDNEEKLTCGVAKYNGQRVTDSEGFCCGCGIQDVIKGVPTRGDLGCTTLDLSSSAHCLAFDPLWYSLFEVDPPQIFYDIEVKLMWPKDPGASWANVSYQETAARLSHQQPSSEGAEGQLRAFLVGDLATAVAPHSFESRYLAVPSRPPGHARVSAERPLDYALLVDKAAVDLSGYTCDKIGVSYTAFKRQVEKCSRPAQSCLASQLDDIHKANVARKAQGLPPQSFVSAFCTGAPELGTTVGGGSGSTRFLGCPLEQRHTTLLRLEARADEAMFVTNVASGQIVSAVAPSFQALQGGGEVNITVISTGSVRAQFTVGVARCSAGYVSGPAVMLSLSPYATAESRIRLIASQTGGGDYECYAELYNALGALLDEKLVLFNVTDLKIDMGAQQAVDRAGKVGTFDNFAGGGDCNSVCPSAVDLACFFAHACWTKLSTLVVVSVLIILGLAFAAWALSRGIPCRVLRCLLCPRQSRRGGYGIDRE